MGQRRFVAGGIFAYKIVKQCMERAEVVQSVKLLGPPRSFCPFSTRFSLLEEAITLAAVGQTELQTIANSLASWSLAVFQKNTRNLLCHLLSRPAAVIRSLVSLRIFLFASIAK